MKKLADLWLDFVYSLPTKIEFSHCFHKNWKWCLKAEIRNRGNLTVVTIFPLTIWIWWY